MSSAKRCAANGRAKSKCVPVSIPFSAASPNTRRRTRRRRRSRREPTRAEDSASQPTVPLPPKPPPNRRRSNAETGCCRKIRPHRARPPRSHDEHRRRTRHQPHQDGRSCRRTRKNDRHSQLLQGAPAGQSQRIPGKVRIQSHSPADRPALAANNQRQKLLASAAAAKVASSTSSANSKWIATTISTSSPAP